MKTLFNLVQRVPTFSWRSLFERARLLKGLLLRVPLIVSGVLSKEVGLAAVSFVREVIRLKRKYGLLFVALYLKQYSVCLQRYYAGSYSRGDSISVPVSLTRCGIPQIIPAALRKCIRARNDRGDTIVKIYLSWFSLAKLVELAPKVSKGTFQSITEIPEDYEGYIGPIKEFLAEMKESARSLWSLYVPTISTIPLEKGICWEPTWKSTPILDSYIRRCTQRSDKVQDDPGFPPAPLNIFT